MEVIKEFDVTNIAKILKEDKLAVFKSDTIYGIFARALSLEAYQNLIRVRPKSEGKYYIVLISSEQDALSLGISQEDFKKVEKLWLGPVTIALSSANVELQYLANKGDQIAVRIPANQNLLSLIKQTGPLLAPSCNHEGEVPATNIEQAEDYFGDQIDLYVDAGEIPLNQLPSTVLSLSGDKLRLLRQGSFPFQNIKEANLGLSLINLPYKKRKLHKFDKFKNNPLCFQKDEFKLNHIDRNFQTINLEVGAGTADLSLSLAKNNPDQLFIAVDVKADRLVQGAAKAHDLELKNIKFLRSNTVDLLNLIPEESINNIWITFPDPMPKKRQQKHRLIGGEFLKLYKQLLKSDGEILFKTDDLNLFHYGLEEITKLKGSLLSLSFDLHSSGLPDDYKITTTYERKFIGEGKPINFVEFKL